MSQTDAMSILEKTKPRLINDARVMKGEGASNEDIAAYLSKRIGLKIGRETVRRWFQKVPQ